MDNLPPDLPVVRAGETASSDSAEEAQVATVFRLNSDNPDHVMMVVAHPINYGIRYKLVHESPWWESSQLQ